MLEVHAYIEVADLERGIAFYCDGLGLALKRRLGPNWVELDGANMPIFLLGNRPSVAELGGTRAERNFTRHWTPVHLDFIVADLDAVVARLVGIGRQPRPRHSAARIWAHGEHGGPVGNGFDLIEFSGAGYDAVSR